jgi:hypothetical protein
MKESEATTKWCPMARIPSTFTIRENLFGTSSANRTQYDEPVCQCYGSDCMMWRFKNNQFKCSKGCIEPKISIQLMKCTCGGKLTGIKDEGFCGLVGQ